MKISLSSRLYVGFTIALLLSLLIGLFSYFTFRRQATDAEWVKHTYKVINTTESVEALLVDMETGRRGFRPTNDKKFLEPYYDGLRSIQPTLQNLESLVADNREQFERVTALKGSINKLLNFWRTLGDDAGAYDASKIESVMNKEKGYMDDVRAQLGTILNTEYRYLREREAKSNRAVRYATGEIVIGTLLMVLIITVLIVVIFREFSQRKKAEMMLGKSMSELQVLNDVAREKNWVLSGVSEINDAMQGVDDLRELASGIINAFSSYLGLSAIAFYHYKEQEQELVLMDARSLPADAAHRYSLGRGLVGAAAQEKTVQVIRDVPENFWKLESAMGAAKPAELTYVPLWFNTELKGVLELASLSSFGEKQVTLLDAVCRNLAIAVNAAEARERIMLLLEQVQKQREALQNQQEELRQSNEELTRQSEVLQASEEELKVQEEELRQINAELEERNEAVELARQALSLKAKELELTSKYKSEFLANMSHELRTPLNSVLILAKLLSENKQQNLSEKQVEYAAVIHKSGSDLLNLINDILDLSKIEAGKVDFNFEKITVASVLQDIQLLFAVVAEEKSVTLNGTIGEQVPSYIVTDKARLEQVIKNLLSNAFKFTPAGGRIDLEFAIAPKGAFPLGDALSRAEKVLAITVRDTGIGIAPDKHQLIFEAFQQADGSTSRKFGGTGLGLSISKELIRRLGGEISLRSEEGKGSIFTLFLPTEHQETTLPAGQAIVLPDMPVFPERPVSEQNVLQDDRKDIRAGDRTMLVIEDDPYFASMVQDFARDKGYKTIVALQGDEGLLYARKYRPTAIILDMQLPVIDGWSLLKLLKNNDNLKHIPVHIISGADESRLSVGGALAYLRKPLGKEDLEGAFGLIEQHLKNKVKKVLVLSGAYLRSDTLKRRIEERHFDMSCSYADTVDKALVLLEEKHFDCVIADIGSDIETGINALQRLREKMDAGKTSLIVYLDTAIGSSEELRLKRVSDVIIRESTQSIDRLMDELELFLYKVQKPAVLPGAQDGLGTDTVLQGRKVLLVDDDMRNVFALSMLLEQQQMKVVTAGDGREALQVLNDHEGIDIVLMDIMMPEMDGYEAMRRIRSNQELKTLPVIALTAKAMPEDREKSLEAGASDYITKPVDNQQLLSLMRVWLTK